jgi:hypothetical protein
VSLLDASPRQLAQDQFVAERDNLTIKLVEGDMADLSAFKDECSDLIFTPHQTSLFLTWSLSGVSVTACSVLVAC